MVWQRTHPFRQLGCRILLRPLWSGDFNSKVSPPALSCTELRLLHAIAMLASRRETVTPLKGFAER